MTLYEIIKSIQATSSKNEKQAILEANKDNVLLREYLKACYDPSINFYVKNLPKEVPEKIEGAAPFELHDVTTALEYLAGRKVTGNAALKHITSILGDFDVEGQELYRYMLLRDVRAGFSDSTILKVWPDLFFVPPYQRCSLMDEKAKAKFQKKTQFLVQMKADGMYMSLVVPQEGAPKAITRQGNTFPLEFAEMLAKDVHETGSVILGEALVYIWGVLQDRKTGNGILNSILKGGEIPPGAVFRLQSWDLIREDDFQRGKSGAPYFMRLAHLHVVAKGSKSIEVIEYKHVSSIEEAFQFYSKMLANGLEGAVIKTLDFLWKDGTSKDCIKLKLEVDVELKCIGMTQGNGKNADLFGSLTFTSSCGNVLVDVSGFSDKERKEIHEDFHLYNGSIATVRCNELISNRDTPGKFSLFLPRFIEWRTTEKTEADSLERIQAQFEAAKYG